MTDTATSVVEELDFNPEIECEATEACPLKAAWVAVCPACGGDVAYCDPHHTVYLAEAVTRKIAKHGGANGCGQFMEVSAVRWEPLP